MRIVHQAVAVGFVSSGLTFALAGCSLGDLTQAAGSGASSGATTTATGAGSGASGSVGGNGAGGNGAGGAGEGLSPEACPPATHPVVDAADAPIPNVRQCSDLGYDPAVDLPEVTLDLYVPPGYVAGARHPAIVYLHGGGWKAGSKSEVKGHELEYLKHGYFVLSLNYRLSDYGPTDHPVDMSSGAPPVNATAIQDVKTALQFIHGHYGDFIDTDHIVAWGFSAGAHLAVLSGVSSNDEADHPELRGRSPGGESSAVRAVVAQSPALDFDLYVADPMPTCGSLAVDPAVCGTPAAPIPGKCVADPACTSPANCAFGDEYITVSRPAVMAMLGAPISDPPSGVTYSVTPLGFVDPGDAAMYLLAGKCDATIPTLGAKEFGVSAAAKGGNVTVKLVETAGHRETMDPATNPTADADVRAWLLDQGFPADSH